MNAKQIRTVKTGDQLRFKRGIINHGCHATFLRIVPDGKDGPRAPTIEYSFAGQIKQISHDHFTI